MATDKLPPLKAKYSIFLPVRNGQPYVAKAIESVLAQRFSDFVLIILENKSMDDTLSIVRSYDDSRIAVIEAPRPLSIYENWRRIYDLINSGAVQSEFSTTLGHDDIFYPEFLTTIDGLVSRHPDASLYQTHFNLIEKTGKIKRPCKPIPIKESHKDFFLARCWGNRDSFGTGYVFKTRDYVKVDGIADYPLLLWSDDLLVIRLTKLSYKVCAGQSVFAYRMYNRSASGTISVNKFAAQAEAAHRYLAEIERSDSDLIANDYDKVAFGYLMARQLDWLDFPFRTILLGKETAKTVEQIKIAATRLMQGNTFEGLSEAHFLDRLHSRLRKYYIMLLHCCQNLPNVIRFKRINL